MALHSRIAKVMVAIGMKRAPNHADYTTPPISGLMSFAVPVAARIKISLAKVAATVIQWTPTAAATSNFQVAPMTITMTYTNITSATV